MTKEKEQTLGYTFRFIETLEFEIIEDAFDKEKPGNLSTHLQFGSNSEKQTIAVTCRFQFMQEEKPFMIIVVKCIFELEESAWNRLLDEEQMRVTLPVRFASHLAMTAIGTIRGILHEKTKGSKFDRLILPPVDLKQIVSKDIVLENQQNKDKES